jgi:hypothetical protein
MDTLSLHNSDKVNVFIRDVQKYAEQNDVACVFGKESHIQYPGQKFLVNGYFIDKEKRELGVATGKPMTLWLPILVHESSHMDQGIEGTQVWKERLVPGTAVEAVDMIFRWIAGDIQIPPVEISDYIRRTRNLELDCERRTVQKINKFDLPIEIEQYIQGANSYLFFYTAMKVTRMWYRPGQEPYNLPEIWSLAPKELLHNEDDYEQVPTALMAAYERILALT